MANVGDIMASIKLDGVGAVNKKLDSLSKGIKSASKGIEKAGKSLSKFGDQTKGLGESLLPMSAGLTAFGTAGILASNEISGAVSSLQTKLGATGTELTGLEGVLSDVASTGVGSFDEVADSIVALKQNMGKLSPKELTALTEQAMQLSDVMGVDVAEVSKTAGIMMKNFGIDGQEAFDLIATGQQKGMDYSGDFLDTLNEYSGQFDSLGFSAEDMFNVLAEGADKGAFNLDKVGDSVKEFNIRAKDGSDATADAFTALGFNSAELTKKFAEGGEGAKKSYGEVVGALSEVESEQERNAIGVSLFGTQYEDMEGDIIASTESIVDHMGDISGKGAEIAEQNQTFSQKMQGAWNELQEAIKPVGDVLKELISVFVEKALPVIKDLAEKFDGLSDKTKKWAVAIGIGLAVLPLLLIAVGTFISFAGSLVTNIGVLVGAFSKLWGGVKGGAGFLAKAGKGIFTFAKIVGKGMFTAVKLIGSGFKLIGQIALKGMMALMRILMANPWIAIVTGIIILVVLIVKNWDKIKEVTLKVWGIIKDFLSGLWESIKVIATSVWTAIKEFFSGVWDSIKAKATEIWDSIKSYLSGIWEGIKAVASSVWGAIKSALIAVWEGLISSVKSIFSGLKEFFNNLWSGIKIITLAVWNVIKALVIAVWNGWVNIAKTVFNGLKTFFSAMWNGIKTVSVAVWNAVVSVVKKLWSNLIGNAKNLFNGLKSFFTSLWDAIKSKAISLWTSLSGTVNSIWNLLVSKAKNLFNNLKVFFANIWNTIKSTATSLWNGLLRAVKKIWSDLISNAKSVFNALKSFLSGLWNGIKSTATSLWSGIKSSILRIVTGVKDSITDKFNALKSKVTEIWDGIKSAITKPIDKAKEAVSKAIDKIKGFMDFEWSLPKLKMPSVSVDMKKNSWGIPVPDFNVGWHASGGIATGASIVGIGEAGDEAIVPLSNKKRMKPFASAVSNMISKDAPEVTTGGNGGSGAPTVVSVQIDGREVAKATAEYMDNDLRGKRDSKLRARGGY